MGQRPAHVEAPAYLTPSPPLPAAEDASEAAARRAREERAEATQADRRDPTRYGDWEKAGIAVDF